MDQPDPNAELLARVKDGDQHALAELFSMYRDRLWRIINFRLDSRLLGRVDADDILQEAYLAAAQRIEHYLDDSTSTFFIWLRLIANQTLIDVHRRHLGAKMRDASRDMSIHAHYAQATSMSIASQLLGNFTSPSQVAMRDEVAAQLDKAIESMEPIDREVLALRHFEELTNSEVAEVLDIQQKAASIRYVRALKRLKDVVNKLPGFNEDKLL
jgi:RNA polymerase sigma-70 factor (ECF subfamily)